MPFAGSVTAEEVPEREIRVRVDVEALSELMQPSVAANSALKAIAEVVVIEKKLLFEVF